MNLRFFQYFFLILGLISGFSSTSIYWTRNCENNPSSQRSLVCKSLNFTSKPGQLILKGFEDTKYIVRNLILFDQLIKTGNISSSPELTKERFIDLEPGFNFNYKPGTRPNAGYLILARSNPLKNGLPSIEIWDLNNQIMIHDYNIDLQEIIKNSKTNINGNAELSHPLLLEDGSLIVNNVDDEYPLIKLDKCGRFLKENNEYKFHHSLAIDNSRKLYAPIYDVDKVNEKLYPREYSGYQGFAILDTEMNILKVINLYEIFENEGLDKELFGGGKPLKMDPIHLNDVEPFIREDGVSIALLSLRNTSSILALDIETEKLIWVIERASLLQHDVDVINSDSKSIDISFFDNNTRTYREEISDNNEYVTFDGLPQYRINNDFVSIANKNAFKKYNMKRFNFKYLEDRYIPRTITEGLSDFISSNNSLMIEETNYGRLLEIDVINNSILWQYINKLEKDSPPFRLSWSRRIGKLPKGLNKNFFKKCKFSY